jgi:hypothetical protein
LIVPAIVVIPEIMAVNDVSDAAVERFNPRVSQIPIWELQRKQETVKLVLNISTWKGMCILCINVRKCFLIIKREYASD